MNAKVDITSIEVKSDFHREILDNIEYHVDTLMTSVRMNFPDKSEEEYLNIEKQRISQIISGVNLEKIDIKI